MQTALARDLTFVSPMFLTIHFLTVRYMEHLIGYVHAVCPTVQRITMLFTWS